MMNQRKVDAIDKNYVNFLIFYDCNNRTTGGPANNQALEYLIMLGGSPEILMFSLAYNRENSIIVTTKYITEFERSIAYSKTNIESCFSEKAIRVNLERFSPENLSNVTLTQDVYDFFEINGFIGSLPLHTGMSILDFALVMLEDTKNWVKGDCQGELDDSYREWIEDRELTIDILLKYGAKPTPKLLLHMLKEGKECSLIQEQLEKIA